MQIEPLIIPILYILITIHSTCGFLTPVSVWNRKHKLRFTDMSIISSTSTAIVLSSTKDDFTMPSPDTLISDIPKEKRGIGVGIDLGTTNSAISILNENGIPYLIKIHGKSTIPSVVTLQSNNDEEKTYQILVGEELLKQDDQCQNTFTYRHVKRVIGMGTDVGE